MTRHNRETQMAKHTLRHWQFYEENFQHLAGRVKMNAVCLFKALKQLGPEEARLLAERYYKSKQKANFSYRVGDYLTVLPRSYSEVSEALNVSEEKVKKELKLAERKLGKTILELHSETKTSEKAKVINQLRTVINQSSLDLYEKQLLLSTLDRIMP